MMTCGERIKQRREELGMSADTLAELTGKNRATIFRYEKGEIETVPIPVIGVIAKALKVSPGYLMGWENGTTPHSDRFRKAVQSELDQFGPDDIAAAADGGIDISFLNRVARDYGVITLDDACKAAQELGEYVSTLLGEIAVQPIMEDRLDQELVRDFSQLTEDERRIVRAAIESFLSARAK